MAAPDVSSRRRFLDELFPITEGADTESVGAVPVDVMDDTEWESEGGGETEYELKRSRPEQSSEDIAASGCDDTDDGTERVVVEHARDRRAAMSSNLLIIAVSSMRTASPSNMQINGHLEEGETDENTANLLVADPPNGS